jgi:organic radical activating enzyme
MITGQRAVIGIYNELKKQNNLPGSMTFETNGTQKLRPEFIEWASSIDTEIFFSVSPKLWTVAGEMPEKAIKPEVVADYYKLSKAGQLKFVVGDADREWNEMESVIEQFKKAGIDYPIWVMPTGAREEEQTATAGGVAERAFKRGYNVAARVHVYLFGNAIGT